MPMRRSFADQFERLDREVMTLPDALYLVSRHESMCRGGVTGFAYAFNRNPTTIAHKFDAGHPGHQLNTIELMDFLRYVSPEGRAIVLDSFHAELGDSQWFSTVPYAEEAEVVLLVSGASEVLHTAADAAQTVAAHIADGHIDARELAETRKLAARIVRVGVGLWLRARHVHLRQKGMEDGA